MTPPPSVAPTDAARIRARRWLLLGAATWLLWRVLLALEMRWLAGLSTCVFVLPSVGLLLWAARLSQDRRLRSALLTRAIAASNLILALLIAMIPSILADFAFSILLAVCSARSLQLLGDRDLDGSGDPTSSFEPVKFRGVLILSLILASADALTLLVSVMWTGISFTHVWLLDDGVDWSIWLPYLARTGVTAAAAVVMAVNVWGLLRLRTWALLGSMLANVVIAALALTDVLTTGSYIAYALVTTAAIQLLLPLPILAAALGFGKEVRYQRVGPVLLRVVVPAIVLATVVAATVQVVSHWS